MNKFISLITLSTACCIHSEQQYPFSLEPLGYAYNALEPSIDTATMEVHYTGHHAAYVKKLNDGLKDYPNLQQYTLSALLTMLDKLPATLRATVQNNAGGHANHTFFWKCMSPKAQKPARTFIRALKALSDFTSFDDFKNKFDEAAQKVFGSGWVWLCYNPKTSKITIMTTHNQDSPITEGLIPLLGLDVWEHAYYLKHKNKRASYIDAWWNVVNWPFVEENYTKAALKETKSSPKSAIRRHLRENNSKGHSR